MWGIRAFIVTIIDRGFPLLQASLGVKVEQKVLDRLVQKKLPKVYQHFKTKLECEPSSVASAWFNTLFAGVLPAPVSLTCCSLWQLAYIGAPCCVMYSDPIDH